MAALIFTMDFLRWTLQPDLLQSGSAPSATSQGASKLLRFGYIPTNGFPFVDLAV